MPATQGAVRREHVEAYLASRRDHIKPASLSIAYRALQQFWKWAAEEEEVERSPMERIRPPHVPEAPVPVVAADQFKLLLHAAEERGQDARVLAIETASSAPGDRLRLDSRTVAAKPRETVKPSRSCSATHSRIAVPLRVELKTDSFNERSRRALAGTGAVEEEPLETT